MPSMVQHQVSNGVVDPLQVGKAYAGPREALRLTGKFVLNQLLGTAGASPQLAASPFVSALRQEACSRPIAAALSPLISPPNTLP